MANQRSDRERGTVQATYRKRCAMEATSFNLAKESIWFF